MGFEVQVRTPMNLILVIAWLLGVCVTKVETALVPCVFEMVAEL